MNKIKVKICGLKRKKDVEMCIRLGVDMLGFVAEYPLPVPWNLERTEALPLLRMVSPPHQTCIVTGGRPEKVIDLAGYLRPSMVQLHYKETLEDTIIISNELQKLNISVIKTIPPNKKDRILQYGTADIKIIVEKLCQTSIYGLLVDSRVPSNASQKGTRLDFEVCKKVINLSSKPVIIAGGIKARNVCALITKTGTAFIDVMTGVEKAPGEKDARSLSQLLSMSKRKYN